MKRHEIISEIEKDPHFDVLVIGGGINGVGTFRDLALQGVRVLLVEKDDFCGGASAGSSHMLHGGIRYLENGEFRLVREALHERNRMLKLAPHYSKPLPTTIPIFKWFSGLLNAPLKFVNLLDRPSERGAIVIKLGLIMYDWFTRGDRVMPTHSLTMRNESLKRYPGMSPEIIATASYYDAAMSSPERICIDLIRDAEAMGQAYAINYFPVTGAQGDQVIMTDSLTGKTYRIQPKTVVNAAGPWIDFVNDAMGEKTRFIGGTKGSHLILDHPELYAATNGSEIFFENKDGRIVLIYPYLDKVMIGTTDIRIDDPETAVCTDEEIDYILSLIPRVFPNIKVDRSQIVYTFSGVRPLPNSESSRTGAISRDHSIRSVTGKYPFPIHSLIGGKWTTWRAFSEEATNEALKDIKKGRKTTTHHIAIGGGRGYPADDAGRQKWLEQLQKKTELPIEQLSILFERYGTFAEEVAEYISQANDKPLVHLKDFSKRELSFIAEREKVLHLDDFLQRRSVVAMLGQATPEVVREAGEALAPTLGWTSAQTEQEIQRMLDILKAKHRMPLN